MTDTEVSVTVLGVVRAEVDGTGVDLGGPLQRALLAMLVAAGGATVPVERIESQLWRGEPPPRALASLQTYVSNLRRLLEPRRRPRTPATVLVTAAPGYALRLPDDAVDAWRFERAVARSRELPPAEAADLLDKALSWWRGPAYGPFADEQWAVADVAHLNELYRTARELAVDARLRSGRVTEAVAPAEQLSRVEPFREQSWRLYVYALWATGRPGDALTALRTHRQIMRDELGLDPSPELAALEADILMQRTEVLADALTGGQSASKTTGTRSARDGATETFFGRAAELRAVRRLAVAAAHTGGTLLLTGEAGMGKSRLLARIAGELTGNGWLVVTGRCPESEGAPAATAWTQALRELAATRPPVPAADSLDPLLRDDGDSPSGDASVGRFRMHQAVAGWLRAAAGTGPLAIVLDDLHAADAETLALLDHVVEESAGRPLLLVGAYRPAEVGRRLAESLAVTARRSPVRLKLGGFNGDDVSAYLAAVAGRPVTDETVAALTTRTGGNPFYLGECARLLGSDGDAAALTEVPSGVRDVLRRRFARLPDNATATLREAAVLGEAFDLDMLAAVAADSDRVRDGVEVAVAAGLLTEQPGGRLAFAHQLVRDTLYTDLTLPARARLHAQVADALHRTRPDDITALAHHYSHAATTETADAAVRFCVQAAAAADRRYAVDRAADLLTQAVAAAERAPRTADHDQRMTELLGRLMRAQIRAGAMLAARETRQRAVERAELSGRDDLLATALAAWSEPTPWLARNGVFVDLRIITALRRLLVREDLDPRTRCGLLDTLVSELDGEDDPDAAEAAAEQLALARRTGDPELIASALGSVARCLSDDLQAQRRAPIAVELRTLANRLGMPRHQWHAEHIAASVCAATGDPAGMMRHAEAGIDLARQFGLAEHQTVHTATRAMMAHIRGDVAGAETQYAAISDQMRRLGTIHGENFHLFAIANLRLGAGRDAEAESAARKLHDRTGPFAGDLLALALARQGRLDEARAVRSGPKPRAFLLGYTAMLDAEIAVALGERHRAPELLQQLAPLRDQLAGVASTAVTGPPISHTIGRIHLMTGNEKAALREFRHAAVVADRWGAEPWAQAARTAERDAAARVNP